MKFKTPYIYVFIIIITLFIIWPIVFIGVEDEKHSILKIIYSIELIILGAYYFVFKNTHLVSEKIKLSSNEYAYFQKLIDDTRTKLDAQFFIGKRNAGIRECISTLIFRLLEEKTKYKHTIPNFFNEIEKFNTKLNSSFEFFKKYIDVWSDEYTNNFDKQKDGLFKNLNKFQRKIKKFH